MKYRGSLSMVVFTVLVQGVVCSLAAAPLRLSESGQARASIVVASDASEVEVMAAAELAAFLQQVTGAEFATANAAQDGKAVIAVGPAAARQVNPQLDVSLASLGHEGIVVRAGDGSLILTGANGARRGTIYAVYTFLTDVVGCRWWAPGASTIPSRPTLDVPALDRRETPAFEYREAYIAHTVDGQWAARNRVNGHFYPIPKQLGGHTVYRGYKGKWGFVHTFNTIVPPDEFFPQHPTWFSEINGKRVAPPTRSQWCLTNTDLLEFVKSRVFELLEDSPPDSIVEVSQNDWRSRCTCAACLAVEQEEGSPSGPLLRFVNVVAEHMEADFPEAVVSTLAYSYTRKPPALARPRPNVCIRLCSIECSFLQPLEHESNTTFADDIRSWSELTDRLYIWDYVTNFAVPLQPHPNLRVLAPNIRFFLQHGGKGMFEEGGHYTRGASFSDIRAWALARLMWNPELDGGALVREFVAGYYEAAAPHIQRYIERLHDVAEESGCYMTCSDRKGAFLSFDLLTEAEALFAEAERAVADSPPVLKRVELAHASVWYGIISRWPWLQRERIARGGAAEWFARSRAEYCVDYVRVCREHGVAEKHITPWETMQERRPAPAPDLVKGLPRTDWVDLQDDVFSLYKPGKWSGTVADPVASDGVAARMPGTTREWAVQCSLPLVPAAFKRKWTVYVEVRVERAAEPDGTAFTAGIYDTRARRSLGHMTVPLSGAASSDRYQLYAIEGGSISPDAYIWVAPAANPEQVKAVWVDRMLLVAEGARE